MKDKLATVLRLLAIAAVIFCGITVVLPQSTQRDDEVAIPVWSDVTAENEKYIKTSYKYGLSPVHNGDTFGTEEPFAAYEAAYCAVRLHEIDNDIKPSYQAFDWDKGAEYIKKAKDYKVWHEALGEENVPLTREMIAVLVAPRLVDADYAEFEFKGKDEMKFLPEVIKAYNSGITVSPRISEAFSPNITATRLDAAKIFSMYMDSSLRIETQIPDYSILKNQLADKMAGWQGDWSLYFEDYNTGAEISINSHQVYSASLIKLFVAQTVYQKIAEGKISDNSKVEDEMRKMLTYSDNDAWRYLAKLTGGGSYSRGMEQTTQIAAASGFSDTGQFYKGEHKNFNFTSVNDCGLFLEKLLDGEIVSEEYSGKILDLLKQQQHLQKIPAGVPEGVETANKTGELDYVQGDAAIVFAPKGAYILTIIGDGLQDSYGQTPKITELSKTVYEFTNN